MKYKHEIIEEDENGIVDIPEGSIVVDRINTVDRVGGTRHNPEYEYKTFVHILKPLR